MSGCSDNIVRVFSVAEGRWLPEADLKLYDEQVANQTLPSQQIGDVKKSDLPGLEALNVPGEWFEILLTSAVVANNQLNRQEARRDKDGQEWGSCRSTSGSALDLSTHWERLIQGLVGLRFKPVDQDWNRRRCRWVWEETALPRSGVGLRVRRRHTGRCSAVETPV